MVRFNYYIENIVIFDIKCTILKLVSFRKHMFLILLSIIGVVRLLGSFPTYKTPHLDYGQTLVYILVRHLLRKIVWDSLRLRFIWLQKTRGLLLWGLLTISISYIKFRRLFYMHINCKEMHQNNFIRLQTIYLLWKLVIIHQILLNIGWVASTLVISNLLTYYNNYALNSFIIKIIHTLLFLKFQYYRFFFVLSIITYVYFFWGHNLQLLEDRGESTTRTRNTLPSDNLTEGLLTQFE